MNENSEARVISEEVPPVFSSVAMVEEPTDDCCKKSSLGYLDIGLIIKELDKHGLSIDPDDGEIDVAEKVLDMAVALMNERNCYSMLLDGAICEYGKDNRLELGAFLYDYDTSCELEFEQFKGEDGKCMMAVSRKTVSDSIKKESNE